MKKAWIIALLLGVVTVGVYWPVTGFQFINLDDPGFVTENPHVRAGLTLGGFKWAFTSEVIKAWHPVTMLSFMLDCQLFGVKPWWPHLVNALLHGANAVLLFVLFNRMTGALWRSAIVAGFFALHPLRVESVAWVCERKDVLSTFFWLLAIWAYLRFVESRKSQGSKFTFYGLSLLFCALGIMSKAMVVTLPLTFLLLDYWPLGRLKEGWRLLWEKIPFLALSAGVSVATIEVQRSNAGFVGLDRLPVGWRLGNAVVGYARYIEMMFWPRHLAGFYPMRTIPWPWWVAGLAAMLLITLSALALWQRVRRPWLTMGWFWYLGTLLPVSGVIQPGSQAIADRFTYVPLIGLFVAAVWGLWEAAEAWRWRRLAGAAAACALATCAGLTVHQEYYWKDSETFNKRLLEVMPHNFMGHSGLGAFYLSVNRTDEALSNCMAAIEEKPAYANAHNQLGIILAEQGRFDDAIRQFEECLRLKPDFAEACHNLGKAQMAKGQTDQAIEQFRKCLRLKPDLLEACYDLAEALGSKGELDEAMRLLRDTIQLAPDDERAHNDMGAALAEKGQIEEAIRQFQEAIRLKPDFGGAHFNLGMAYEKKGQTNEAIRELHETLRLEPGSVEAQKMLRELGESN